VRLFSRNPNPYRPPIAANDPEPGAVVYRYRPLATLSKTLVGLLVSTAVIETLRAIAWAGQSERFAQMRKGLLTYSEASRGVDQLGWLDAALNLVLLATMVVFCVFLPSANRNARALGARPVVFTPRWTSVVFFVPILNLYKPYQAVKEIWKASEPDLDVPWREASVPAFFPIWWVSWLSWNIVARMGSTILVPRSGLGADAPAIGLESCLLVTSSVLAALIVHGIRSRQEERVAAIQRS
jgi:hypothetical protein